MSPQEGKAYYEQTGVGPLPVVLYNGMPLQREQLDPDELETVIMHKILETTSFFQRTVYLVRITCLSPIVSVVSFFIHPSVGKSLFINACFFFFFAFV